MRRAIRIYLLQYPRSRGGARAATGDCESCDPHKSGIPTDVLQYGLLTWQCQSTVLASLLYVLLHHYCISS